MSDAQTSAETSPRVIDLTNADWEYVDQPGMGDPLLEFLSDVLGQLTQGRRAVATAEALIFANLVTDATALRAAAERNAPVEEYLSYVDARELVRLITERGGEAATGAAQNTGVLIGGGVLAGILGKSLYDRLT